MNEQFSESLRKLREARGLSQKQLGEQIFTTQSTVARWENGARLPGTEMIHPIAKCLGADMSYSTDVAAARALATKAHEGQTDKAGLPYITHPQRVASRLDRPELQVIGWLHDTVEDTEITVRDIAEHFGPETAAAVDAISRRDAEPWSDYLDRVAANPMARQVKISDLIDNSNLSRIPHVTLRVCF